MFHFSINTLSYRNGGKEVKRNIVLLIIINLVLIVLVAFFYVKMEHYKKSVPYITIGEKLPNISFLTEKNEIVAFKSLFTRPAILFIFERPCSTCTKNIVFWNKLYELTKNKVFCYGIIQEKSIMMELAKNRVLPFQLIAPNDMNEFKSKWRVYLNSAQTILVNKNKVKWIEIGEIGEESIKKIRNEIDKEIGR